MLTADQNCTRRGHVARGSPWLNRVVVGIFRPCLDKEDFDLPGSHLFQASNMTVELSSNVVYAFEASASQPAFRLHLKPPTLHCKWGYLHHLLPVTVPNTFDLIASASALHVLRTAIFISIAPECKKKCCNTRELGLRCGAKGARGMGVQVSGITAPRRQESFSSRYLKHLTPFFDLSRLPMISTNNCVRRNRTRSRVIAHLGSASKRRHSLIRGPLFRSRNHRPHGYTYGKSFPALPDQDSNNSTLFFPMGKNQPHLWVR